MSLIKPFIRNSILAIVVLLIGIESPNFHMRFLREYVGSSVVMVKQLNGGGGTGFGVKTASGREAILTNKHVCGLPIPGVKHIVFIEENKELVPAKVLKVDTEHDLCLVENPTKVKALSTGYFNPNIGDTVAIIGHPFLTPMQVSKGIYNGYTERADLGMLSLSLDLPLLLPVGWTSAPSYPGNSGSPVVNFYGQVIGVLFAGMAPHINMIVPLSAIERFLSTL